MSALRKAFRLVIESYKLFGKQRATSRGAAIAFYVVTSITPVLIIIIAVAGMAFGHEAATTALFGQFEGLIGRDSAAVLQKAIAGAANVSGGIAATAVSIVTILLAASGVFLELEDALNGTWGFKRDEGIASMARARVWSLGIVIALAFVMTVSLVIDAGLTAAAGSLPILAAILKVVGYLLSFLLVAFLFAVVFRFLPAQRLPWRDVWFGAAVTAFLFEIGKILIGLYLGSNKTISSLGAAGALLALLFWIYYTAQVFLFGASFTRTHALVHGAKSDSRH